MKIYTRCIAVLAASVLTSCAFAQSKYPERPVRLLVPFAPGGGTDIVARIIAQQMTDALGQSVVVDNRAGAGGSIGEEMISKAAPDGYTLGMVSGYGTNAAIYKLSYDPVADVTAVVSIGDSGFVLALHPSVPLKSVKELVAHAKSNPGKLNYASSGTGAITHLSTELFDLLAGTRMTHVPFKGTGPALAALLGHQVDLIFGSMPATSPHVRSGKLRGLAVTTRRRLNALPDLPPIADTVPGYESVLVYGMLGPKGLPLEIVTRWNASVNKILQTREMKDRLANDGVEPAGGPPEVFGNVVKRDVETWRRVVREAKLGSAS